MNLTSESSQMNNLSQGHEKVIFFDLGDTLIYFDGDWSKVLQRSTKNLWKNLVSAGYPLNREQFSKDFSDRMRDYYIERNKSLIEGTSAKILKECLIDLGFHEPGPDMLKSALNAMYSVSQEFWNLEDDTRQILQWLEDQNYRIGLISNASDVEDVYALLRKFGLTAYFEHIIISAEFGYRKPLPEIFKEGLRLFQANPQDCFMVGDRLNMDILGANQVNIPSIWITRRSIHKEMEGQFNIKPNYKISTLLEIKEILQKKMAAG